MLAKDSIDKVDCSFGPVLAITKPSTAFSGWGVFCAQLLRKVNFPSNHRTKKPETSVSGFVSEVVPPGIEPGTHGFSVRCSTN